MVSGSRRNPQALGLYLAGLRSDEEVVKILLQCLSSIVELPGGGIPRLSLGGDCPGKF